MIIRTQVCSNDNSVALLLQIIIRYAQILWTVSRFRLIEYLFLLCYKKTAILYQNHRFFMVGPTGLEPVTPCL